MKKKILGTALAAMMVFGLSNEVLASQVIQGNIEDTYMVNSNTVNLDNTSFVGDFLYPEVTQPKVGLAGFNVSNNKDPIGKISDDKNHMLVDCFPIPINRVCDINLLLFDTGHIGLDVLVGFDDNFNEGVEELLGVLNKVIEPNSLNQVSNALYKNRNLEVTANHLISNRRWNIKVKELDVGMSITIVDEVNIGGY